MTKSLQPEDAYPALVCVLRRLAVCHNYNQPFVVEFGARMFADWLTSGNAKAYVWVDQSGEPHGVLIGVICPDSLTGVLTGYEHLWAVEPSWRMTRAPLALLAQFQKDCKERGCKRLVVGTSQQNDPARVAKLYAKLGFVPETQLYAKEI